MEKTLNARICKTDHREQTATGLIFAPMILDSQGDFMSAEGIQATSEKFMKAGLTRSIDVAHSGHFIDAFVSENMITAGDGDFPAGSWVVTAKVQDPDVWKQIEDGELNGFSLSGQGSRVPKNLDGKPARQIVNLEVFSISLVDRPANKKTFSVLKSETGNADFDAAVAELAEICAKTQQALQSRGVPINKQTQANTSAAVIQSVAREQVRKAEKIEYWERKLSHLQATWESIIGRPDLSGSAGREARVREQIEDAECELSALGKKEGATLENTSAFGGTSVQLEVTPASFDSNPLGIRSSTNEIKKSNEPLGNNTMGVREDYENLNDIDLCSLKF